jgi:APA family basic amino acid/polyamine antiporter
MAVGGAIYVSYIFGCSPMATKAIAVASIVLLAGLNMLGARIGAGILRAITGLKFAVLALIVFWAFAFRLGSWSHFVPFVAQRPGSLPLLPALGGALVAAFFSFGGWWDVSKLGGEVKDPTRNLPRAMVLGVLLVIVAYALVSAVFVYLVPLDKVTSDRAFVAQAGEVLFGRTGATLLSGCVVICVFGSVAALILLCPRVYYAMARDGVFLPSVAQSHPRFGTPTRAITIQAVMASALVLLGNFDQIIAYFIFVAVLFLGLTVLGIFVLRNKSGGAQPATPAPGYPFTPIAFLVLIAVLLVLLMAGNPRQALLGCAVVLAGVPVYVVIRRRETSVLAIE